MLWSGFGRNIVYPERAFWSEKKIRMYLSDLIANGDVDPSQIDNVETDEIDHCCHVIEDTGRVTFDWR